MRWVTRTITAADLPPRTYTAEDRRARGYEWLGGKGKEGAWHRNGVPLCSRSERGGSMMMQDGRLVRSPAPPICGRRAAVRMVNSRRYYCAFHAPKHGDREAVQTPEKGG